MDYKTKHLSHLTACKLFEIRVPMQPLKSRPDIKVRVIPIRSLMMLVRD